MYIAQNYIAIILVVQESKHRKIKEAREYLWVPKEDVDRLWKIEVASQNWTQGQADSQAQTACLYSLQKYLSIGPKFFIN